MEISRELQKLIDENASTLQLEEMAVKNGMIRLGMNGERKVASGLTTVEEVTRVLGTNW
jgi:type II secretory ATPase GspE/PulE/Tfp pilus assembly ATPase PilB-like protein